MTARDRTRWLTGRGRDVLFGALLRFLIALFLLLPLLAATIQINNKSTAGASWFRQLKDTAGVPFRNSIQLIKRRCVHLFWLLTSRSLASEARKQLQETANCLNLWLGIYFCFVCVSFSLILSNYFRDQFVQVIIEWRDGKRMELLYTVPELLVPLIGVGMLGV